MEVQVSKSTGGGAGEPDACEISLAQDTIGRGTGGLGGGIVITQNPTISRIRNKQVPSIVYRTGEWEIQGCGR